MDQAQVRAVIVDALNYASVCALHHKKLTQDFLDGADVSFADLNIDSLAAMELCIALEDKTGVSIMPDELEDIGGLNGLAELLVEGDGMIVKLYRRLASYARTINKFNRNRIAVENILTPLELEILSQAELEDLGADLRPGRTPGINTPTPEPSRHATDESQLKRQIRRATAVSHKEWCEKLNKLCAQSNKSRPEAFVRRRLAPNMLLFSSGGDTRQKTLIFCFSGTTRRMMLPTPAFLQSMDASRVDIALLCDSKTDLYRNGVSGIEGDMPSLFDHLEQKMDRKAYRSAVALGTSAGGLPALLCALRLGLDRVLCVSGSDPYDERFVGVAGIGAAVLLQQYAKQLNEALPEIFTLCSADYPVDQASVKGIKAALSGLAAPQMLEFQPRNEVFIGHTLFPAVLEAGELSALFEVTLLANDGHSSTLLRDWAVSREMAAGAL